MDREPTSLPQQLGTGIKNRFSYCLSPTTSSYVRFGDEAVIQGRNVQRTPFLETKNKRSVTSYALPLMDLSINGRRLGEVPEGIYIDSGSSLSLLETSVYVALCGGATLPTMFFHFTAAPANLFFFPGGNVLCLAALESKTISILGSFQQRNVRFVYDLQQKMLSFAPEECSRD
ncbi:aspartic proteinase CDR1-like [Salvia splendens]|uniref:aspartic proteinase CDR1-like n=1 Tax=Salvia splendens TaxID=180675 RepID=UPI001C27C4CE|nr:aspartic proteinase CDR1-like [Salvia splendens]